MTSAIATQASTSQAEPSGIQVTSAIASTSQAFSTHTFYPQTNRDGPDRKKKKYVERYPCAVTSEKWRQMYTEKEEAKERDNTAKQNRKHERERKRLEKEELKVKRAQEVNGRKNKKKDSDRMRKDGKAKSGKYKRQSTTENEDTRKRTKRNPCSICGESVGMTGPGKFGLQCSSCRNKFHVSCIGKRHLEHFHGYDESDTEDEFEFQCSGCFHLDDESELDVHTSDELDWTNGHDRCCQVIFRHFNRWQFSVYSLSTFSIINKFTLCSFVGIDVRTHTSTQADPHMTQA